jgi:hypothetical protein
MPGQDPLTHAEAVSIVEAIKAVNHGVWQLNRALFGDKKPEGKDGKLDGFAEFGYEFSQKTLAVSEQLDKLAKIFAGEQFDASE